MADALEPIRKALKDAKLTREALPWRLVSERAVGGLIAVGFERNNENLLVVSPNGQSVIDCTSGEVVYRNREENGYDIENLQGRRLDNPSSPPFSMSGLDGGKLRAGTSDGWGVQEIAIEWPKTHCFLEPPNASIFFSKTSSYDPFDRDSTFFLLSKDISETRAFGFSWTGKTLIWADSSDLRIWHRQ